MDGDSIARIGPRGGGYAWPNAIGDLRRALILIQRCCEPYGLSKFCDLLAAGRNDRDDTQVDGYIFANSLVESPIRSVRTHLIN